MGSYSICVILLYVVHMVEVPHNLQRNEKRDGSGETEQHLKEILNLRYPNVIFYRVEAFL